MTALPDYDSVMRVALDEARLSGADVPVGAVVLDASGAKVDLSDIDEAR